MPSLRAQHCFNSISFAETSIRIWSLPTNSFGRQVWNLNLSCSQNCLVEAIYYLLLTIQFIIHFPLSVISSDFVANLLQVVTSCLWWIDVSLDEKEGYKIRPAGFGPATYGLEILFGQFQIPLYLAKNAFLEQKIRIGWATKDIQGYPRILEVFPNHTQNFSFNL